MATSVSEAAAGCAAGRAALGVAPGDVQGRTAAFSAAASAASRPVKPRGAQCLHHYLSGGGAGGSVSICIGLLRAPAKLVTMVTSSGLGSGDVQIGERQKGNFIRYHSTVFIC